MQYYPCSEIKMLHFTYGQEIKGSAAAAEKRIFFIADYFAG